MKSLWGNRRGEEEAAVPAGHARVTVMPERLGQRQQSPQRFKPLHVHAQDLIDSSAFLCASSSSILHFRPLQPGQSRSSCRSFGVTAVRVWDVASARSTPRRSACREKRCRYRTVPCRGHVGSMFYQIDSFFGIEVTELHSPPRGCSNREPRRTRAVTRPC